MFSWRVNSLLEIAHQSTVSGKDEENDDPLTNMAEEEEMSSEIAGKDRQLHERVRMLVVCETLIRHNLPCERPISTVSVPPIIAGFNSSICSRSNRSLDG
jgi:hypothetical protein